MSFTVVVAAVLLFLFSDILYICFTYLHIKSIKIWETNKKRSNAENNYNSAALLSF